jgi:xanthine dehydrogenase YagR molybdenum-binding subunit
MSIETTRRGFLRGSVGAAVAGSACSREMVTERGKGPAQPADEETAERVRVRTTVNEKASTHEVHPEDTALHVLRGDLGLTGCKQGCGHGACGACTVAPPPSR